MLKSARLILLWPLWVSAFPAARWVIVRRADQEVVRGAQRTGYIHGAYRDPEGWQAWLNEYKARFSELHQAGVFAREIWPGDCFDGRTGALRDLVDWAGLQWNPADIGGDANGSTSNR
jgi:hypothetical protein